MKVTVIEGCISCGLCTEEYPELFQMDDEGIARPVSEQVPQGREADALQAAEDCPVDVIVTEG